MTQTLNVLRRMEGNAKLGDLNFLTFYHIVQLLLFNIGFDFFKT